MDRLDVLNLFVRVAEAGSFSKAAQQSGIAQSTASKRIASLEKRLGAHLLRRTSRGLALTSAGQHYYDEALRLVDAFEQLDEFVGKRERTPAGVLRLTCPPGLATSYLLPRLGPFRAEFPGILLDFVVSQGNLNLVEEGIDLAIRFGDLEDSEMRSRQVRHGGSDRCRLRSLPPRARRTDDTLRVARSFADRLGPQWKTPLLGLPSWS
jgi:LysR family transcriptional regulator for bpeEF and oprC